MFNIDSDNDQGFGLSGLNGLFQFSFRLIGYSYDNIVFQKMDGESVAGHMFLTNALSSPGKNGKWSGVLGYFVYNM